MAEWFLLVSCGISMFEPHGQDERSRPDTTSFDLALKSYRSSKISNISPIPIPVIIRPAFRHRRIPRQSVLSRTHTFTLALQPAQTVNIAVALFRIRTVHSVFAEDYYDLLVLVPGCQNIGQRKIHTMPRVLQYPPANIIRQRRLQ